MECQLHAYKLGMLNFAEELRNLHRSVAVNIKFSLFPHSSSADRTRKLSDIPGRQLDELDSLDTISRPCCKSYPEHSLLNK